MRIVVLLPSEQQLDTAGVRIRYRRIEPALRRLGHRLDLMFLEDVDAATKLDADAYLFCKCQDVRAVIFAQRAAAAGRLVGADIFDDYFSQHEDGRLAPFRRWWDDMRPFLSFLLCATPAMAERLAPLAPGIPAHVLNDPMPSFDPEAMASLIESKVERARSTGVIKVAWFGMGDNPVFPVGLDDLSAFGLALADLRVTGFQPRLRVLTNRRAMTPRRIEGLARLPIPTELAEWSVEAEAELLRESLASVLPVNARPFSTVKSLNRAVTALTSGTQVLSLGHPLYEALGPFVYRSCGDLLGDLADGGLRLRRETIPALMANLAESGAPEVEAGQLAAFLSGLRTGLRRRTLVATRGVVLHGTTFNAAVNGFAQRQGWLTVAGPLGANSPEVDITFEQDPDGPVLAVLSDRACPILGPSDRSRLRPHPERGDLHGLAMPARSLPGFRTGSLAERIVRYPAVLAEVRGLLDQVFPGLPIILSEQAPPFVATCQESQPA